MVYDFKLSVTRAAFGVPSDFLRLSVNPSGRKQDAVFVMAVWVSASLVVHPAMRASQKVKGFKHHTTNSPSSVTMAVKIPVVFGKFIGLLFLDNEPAALPPVFSTITL